MRMNNPEITALQYALEKFGLVAKSDTSSNDSLGKLFELVFKSSSPSLGLLRTIFKHAENFDGKNLILPITNYHPFESFPTNNEKESGIAAYAKQLNFKNTLFSNSDDLNSTHYLLKEYFGNIGVNNLEGGSFYSYLKSFCGISKAIDQSDTGKLLFIGGDLSGIQSFIYSIISKYAAKNLKGRSFYLQLLADAAVLRLQKELGISDFNLIYSSGGGFFMFCGDSKENIEIIEKVRAEIELELFDKHGLELYFAIDYVAVEPEILFNKDLTKAWSELIEKTNVRKKQKFHKQLIGDFNKFFSPISTSELGIRDAITNEEIYSKKDAKPLSEESDNSYLKKITHFQIKLGKLLKSSEHLNYKVGKIDLDDPSTIFGVKFLLSKEPEIGYNNLKINPDKGSQSSNGIFYGGNHYPSDPKNHEPITFDELAASAESGIKRLGILRMDVDNLGKLFIKGFGDHTHIAAYNELSSRLDGFFKGYLNQLVKENKYDNKVIILYSGGDDLFIAGAYQAVLELSGDIRDTFQKWVGGSMQPGLSGGMAIVGGKFPVIKAAELAGDLEKKAKGFSRENEILKNAMCLFGIPFSWDKEYDEVIKWRDRWKEWFKSEKISKGILFKMYQYYEAKENKELKWQWQSLYTLKRQEKKSNQEEIDYLKSNVIIKGKENYRALDLCVIGGRLAEIGLRKQN